MDDENILTNWPKHTASVDMQVVKAITVGKDQLKYNSKSIVRNLGFIVTRLNMKQYLVFQLLPVSGSSELLASQDGPSSCYISGLGALYFSKTEKGTQKF